MSTLPIQSVKKLSQESVKKQVGGIKSILLTEMSNLILGNDPMMISDIYEINFRKFSGRYSDSTRDSRAGQYDEQSATCYIPGFRFSVEVIRQKLRDRKVGAIITDWMGNVHIMRNATVSISFDTGSTLGDSSGYNFELRASKHGAGLFNVNVLADIQLLEGPGVEGSVDFGGGAGSVPDGGSNPVQDCCILIHQTTIPAAPPASGNVFNLNRIVTTDDGEKYFIDKNGNSILLNDSKANVRYEKIQGDGGAVYTPSVIDLTAVQVPQAQLIVERFGAVMTYTASHNPSDPDGAKKWTIDDTDLVLSNVFPLESWEYVQLLKIA